MTNEEKRRLLKEQYKRDLKMRKEFLEKAKGLRQSQKINKAVTDITESLNFGDADEWINKLNQESALTEAKLEIAMEEQSSTTEKLETLAREAEAEKFNAERLVRQMKREMGLLTPEEEAEEKAREQAQAEAKALAEQKAKAEAEQPEAGEEQEEPKPKDPPEKKLGDF